MENLKYPIGRLVLTEHYAAEQIAEKINDLKIFPKALKKVVSNLSETHLNKTYRKGS